MGLAVTDRFRRTVGASHTVAQRVELLVDGVVEADLTDAGVLVEGQVQASIRNAILRSASLSLLDETGLLVPNPATGAGRALMPAGSELRLWRGIAYPNHPPELLALGTMRFVVTSVRGRSMTLECYDRAWALSQAKALVATSIANGTNLVAAIRRLVNVAGGEWLDTNLPATDEVVPSMAIDVGQDLWALCQQLAANVGNRLYFDPMGTLTMTPEPDPGNDPVAWTLDEQADDNLALPGAEVRWEGTGPNAVVAIGENSDNGQVWRGVAYDTDANSLTRYDGPYGRIHGDPVRDEKIASPTQANARARKELNANLGLIVSPSTTLLPNAALEPGDVLLTPMPSQGFGTWAILDGFTMPLRADQPMPVQLRERHIRELGPAPV